MIGSNGTIVHQYPTTGEGLREVCFRNKGQVVDHHLSHEKVGHYRSTMVILYTPYIPKATLLRCPLSRLTCFASFPTHAPFTLVLSISKCGITSLNPLLKM